MNAARTHWIHPATFTYSLQEPETPLQTLWVHRAGWGYLMRRDLWLKVDCSTQEIVDQGYVEMAPGNDADVSSCPYCRMHICGIPGYLKDKHRAECGDHGEDHLGMEDSMISERRRLMYEKTIMERKRREQEELEEMERKERFGKIREEAQAKQIAKDRKKRIKAEAKELLRKKL